MVQEHIKPGDVCIDATMGNGNDTEFLCRAVGPSGRVIAFDVQEAALEHTRGRLFQNLEFVNYELHLESHEQLEKYGEKESISAVLFNLGYLPGGDHKLATRPESSLRAMEAGLSLLKPGGIMSVCIYSGGDSGFEEKDAVLQWLRSLDPRHYLVLVTEYYNRPNHPPIPALVVKLS